MSRSPSKEKKSDLLSTKSRRPSKEKPGTLLSTKSRSPSEVKQSNPIINHE
jgi:hypothetical protein